MKLTKFIGALEGGLAPIGCFTQLGYFSKGRLG
jgi:hypothetical protein